jgi:AbrB family looped-hinge helix DNA binding protein
MDCYTARLDKFGRILIPASVRRDLRLSEGSAVVVKVETSGALKITSRSQALAKVRKEIRNYIPPGRDLAEELIRDRRKKARRS